MSITSLGELPASSSSPLARLRAWWIAEARQTVWPWSRDPLTAPGAPLVVLRPRETDVEVLALSRGEVVRTETVPLDQFGPRSLPAVRRRARLPRRAAVVLEPPPGVILTHSLVLPEIAAEAAPSLVDDVVRRKTPMSPDRLHVAHAVGPAESGKAVLRIALVPRDWATGQLARIGLGPDNVVALMIPAAGQEPLFARLAPLRPGRAGAVIRAALLLAGLAGASWLGLSAWRSEAALHDVDARLAAVAPQAREAIARSRASGDARALVDALQERRAKAGPLALWRELTRLLPPDTFLVELQIGEREVTMSGYSAAPAALVPILEASPLFKEAAFAGAIVYDPQERRERFSIRAALRHPQPAPETLR